MPARLVRVTRCLGALILLASGAAHAEPVAPPATRLLYRVSAGARYNPVGAGLFGRLALRQRMYGSDNLALRDNAVTGAVIASLTPAFARAGASVEVSPVSFLTLFGTWEGFDYFGTSNFFQSFPSAASDTGPTEMERLGRLSEDNAQAPYSTRGQQVTAGATAAVQWKQAFVRDQVRWMWSLARMRSGDRVFLDPNVDLVLPNGGWSVFNDLEAGWTDGRWTDGRWTDGRWTVALTWNVQTSLFRSSDYLPGQRATPAEGWRQRLGPTVNYAWAQPAGSRFVPSVFAQVQWWLSHPYRTGQEMQQALPWVLLAFTANGDLL